MKDEIKEKIRQWYVDDDLISILNYITNLQEDLEYSDYCNKKLREKITNLEYKINLLQGVGKDE